MQKIYPDRILKKLANLQFAIILLFIIGVVIAIGTIIEQDQSLTFYQQNYPETAPLFGFLTWKFLTRLNFDHIYTSYWFVGLLIIFGLSLLSCTLTVQFPTLRRLRRWKFYKKTQSIGGIKSAVPLNSINTLSYHLHRSRYSLFRQGKANYAYSGLIGRFGPIVVHASIIFLLLGSTVGAFSGYVAQEIVPRGEVFHIQNLIKVGQTTNLQQKIACRVNDFWITYANNSNTDQFYSDLSILDNSGNELKRKTIFVNEPLVYKGMTIYQTDWDIVGLKVKSNNNTQQLALKKIVKSGQKFWFGTLRDDTGSLPQLSILCNDLSGTIYIYDSNGALIKNCELGQKVSILGQGDLMFSEFLTSTGLQIKTDPGIRTIYLAFFLLMVSTYVSFISYSQVWTVEKDQTLTIMGTSNRAVLQFQSQFRELAKKVTVN